MKFKFLALAAMLCAANISQAANVQFAISYIDAAGVGFNDATYGAQRKAVLESATNFWSSKLVAGYAGETISILAGSDPASTSSSPGSSNASNTTYYFGGTAYGAASAQHVQGTNLSNSSTFNFGATTLTSSTDARLIYNFTSGMTAQTYLGLDGATPADQYDMLTYSKRYIAKILGFESRVTTGVSNQGAFYGGLSSTYDRLVAEKQVDGSFLYLTAMTPAQRVAAMSSSTSNLYWTGANTTAANGGEYLKLQTRALNSNGTINSNSMVWVDPSISTLMSGGGLGVSRDADALTYGQLQDLGWTIAAVPEPSTYAMLLAGLGMIGFVARRRRA